MLVSKTKEILGTEGAAGVITLEELGIVGLVMAILDNEGGGVIYEYPLHVPGTLHFPSSPAGPASTGTSRPFRSISAMVTHQGIPNDTSMGRTDGPPWAVT
jgi:hypothetical protein